MLVLLHVYSGTSVHVASTPTLLLLLVYFNQVSCLAIKRYQEYTILLTLQCNTLCSVGILVCPCTLACPHSLGCGHLPCLPGTWMECTPHHCVCVLEHSSSTLPRNGFYTLKVNVNEQFPHWSLFLNNNNIIMTLFYFNFCFCS